MRPTAPRLDALDRIIQEHIPSGGPGAAVAVTRAGMSYQDFIQEHIFEPLGMLSSGYLSRDHIIPNLATGYQPDENCVRYPHPVDPSLVYATGAPRSTVEDLAHWDAAMREGRPLETAIQARMEQPLTLTRGRREGYGLGWGLSRCRGHRVIHHAGGVPGYSSFIGRFVDDDLTVIILSNWGLFDAAVLLARPIANLLLDLPEPPTPKRPPALEASARARMSGAYANMFGEPLDFTADDGTLRASGELNADLLPFTPNIFRAAHDPDIQVSFEDETSQGYSRATVTVPFYWYVVYRQPSA